MSDLPEETAGDNELQQGVPWRGRDAFYVILLYLLSVFFLACPLGGATGSGVDLLLLVPLGVVTLIWTRLYRSSGLLLGTRFRFGVAPLLGGTLTGIMVLFLELAFAWAVLALLDPELLAGLEEALALGGFTGNPIVILSLVVFGPVIEELFFRGLLQQGVQRSFGGGVGVAVSSLLFGLAHIQGSWIDNVIGVGNGILVGIVLGYLFLRTKNLAVPIVAHATLNAGALLLASVGI